MVGLPSRVQSLDKDQNLLNDIFYYYDEAAQSKENGKVSKGLLKLTEQLVYVKSMITPEFENAIDPAWNLVKKTDGYYKIAEQFKYDAVGNVLEQRQQESTITFTYDADNVFPLKAVDQDGNVTTSAFDLRTCQPREVVTDNGKLKTIYEYTPLGRLRAQLDLGEDGKMKMSQAFFYRDVVVATGEPSQIISVRPINKEWSLSDLLEVADVTTIAGASVEIDFYDGSGNVLQRSIKNGSEAGADKSWTISNRRKYTCTGKQAEDYPNLFASSPKFLKNPEGDSVQMYYGSSGQIVKLVHPDGSTFKVKYYFSRIEKFDALASDDKPVVERYNAMGNLISVEQPKSDSVLRTSYEVDIGGRILNIRDGDNKVVTTYKYGGPGPAYHVINAEAGDRMYWHDAFGKLRLRKDNLGRAIEFNYDNFGRLVEARDVTTAASPKSLRKLSYNNRNVLKVTEGDISTDYTYNQIGQLTKKSIQYGGQKSLSIQFGYSMQGQVDAITYPDGTKVDTVYYDSGLTKGLTGFVENISYNAHRDPQQINFNGSISLEYGYNDVMRRLISSSLKNGANTLRSLALTYDANGQITSVEDQLKSELVGRRYHYDELYRISRAETLKGGLNGQQVRNDTYTYSDRGDMLTNGESDLLLKYSDSTHPCRITSVKNGANPEITLTHDAGGKLIKSENLTSLTYDVWDRLISATTKDGTVINFHYDHTNACVKKETISNGVTTVKFSIDKYYEETATQKRVNIFFGKLLVAVKVQENNGLAATSYLFSDHLGSVLSECSSAGEILNECVFTPFGRVLQTQNAAESRYAGSVSDQTIGLVQMGVRYYSPLTGRFITPDWFILENPTYAQHLPQAFNVYSYAINNPIMLRDPTGKWFGIDDLIVAGIGFVVGFVTGFIVGLAQGRSFKDSLLLGLEAGVLGAVGAWLAWNTAGLALGLLGSVGITTSAGVATGIMVTAAVFGGLNGVISGATEIYDWKGGTGFLAFFADSTWGLLGTSIGVLLHGVNLFYGGDRNYRPELSKRQNRHVYDGGFGFGNFAFTQGNVTSNLNGRRSDLVDHETLHIWQSRLFGPLFQLTYVGWLVVGAVIGLILSPFTDQSWKKDIEDMAYYNNFWEGWAYETGGHRGGGSLQI